MEIFKFPLSQDFCTFFRIKGNFALDTALNCSVVANRNLATTLKKIGFLKKNFFKGVSYEIKRISSFLRSK